MQGTERFSERTRRADGATEAAYDRRGGMLDQISDRLAALSPPDADPRAMGDEIARIAAMDAGTHPFRSMVDFLRDGAEQVNRVAEEMQAGLMDRLGIADLLRPATPDEEAR